MRVERSGPVAILKLENGKANSISPLFLERLERLLAEIGDARAAVMIGQGSAFSAGLDLPALVDLDRAAMRSFILRFDAAMLRVFELPVPLVAAVNGHAVAGGCVLALQADVRIGADREARIGLDETQLGIGLPAVVLETLRSPGARAVAFRAGAGRTAGLGAGSAAARALARGGAARRSSSAGAVGRRRGAGRAAARRSADGEGLAAPGSRGGGAGGGGERGGEVAGHLVRGGVAGPPARGGGAVEEGLRERRRARALLGATSSAVR